MPQRTPEVRAIITTDGQVVRGDTDYRPGDPIITRTGLSTVEKVLPPNLHPTDDPNCIQEELPLFWD